MYFQNIPRVNVEVESAIKVPPPTSRVNNILDCEIDYDENDSDYDSEEETEEYEGDSYCSCSYAMRICNRNFLWIPNLNRNVYSYIMCICTRNCICISYNVLGNSIFMDLISIHHGCCCGPCILGRW